MTTRNTNLRLVAGEAAGLDARERGAGPECDPEQRDFVDYLFTRYRGSLSRYLMLLLRDREETEEILQESYIRIIQTDKLDRLEARARSYLFKIATNLVRDRARRARAGERHVSTSGIELVSGVAQPDRENEWSELQRRVRECLVELRPRCRRVFILHVFEELTYPEIAGILGVSTKTVERDFALAVGLCQARLAD